MHVNIFLIIIKFGIYFLMFLIVVFERPLFDREKANNSYSTSNFLITYILLNYFLN